MSLLRLAALAILLLVPRVALAQDDDAPVDGGVAAPADPVDAGVSPDSATAPTQDATPTPTPAPTPAPAPAAPSRAESMHVLPDTGFQFGSYGRVSAASDLRGGTPEKIGVVAHAPRIVEPSYVETDLYYRWLSPHGTFVRTVTTLAFGDSLFHYTGQFDAAPALRNLFLEATTPAWTFWAGSRMYRGDDIYVFDWWPLDDLNTLGAGVSWHGLDKLRVDLHVGVNRLLDPFQYETKDVSDPDGVGAVTVSQLDRQRTIADLAITHFHDLGSSGRWHGKAKLYSEVQALPTGRYKRPDASIEELPRDYGLSIGGQLGVWSDAGVAGGPYAGSSANLFARFSRGLTAFDELTAPTGLDVNNAAWKASELVLGVGAAGNATFGNVVAGAYARRFVDADASVDDRDDGWEYAVDARPEVKLGRDFLAGVDLSYQVRFPRGLSPVTLLAADPAVFEAAPMLVYSPMGNGAFDRPELRLVWRIAQLNDAALDDYPPGDPRTEHATVYYLGAQAEWWFNSSTR